eukprot:CAMPEP_0196218610 /NCGR_PEP_ID=MMETSP0912-20130531/36915_1 /TAXON_ID=49265 /ORGANISM="Thalassiosira rotula, Strain GSO102" /LENGTH=43 /DNA_ID= /DNA_START= /DNA_END= /DNA_ORIENTATION=
MDAKPIFGGPLDGEPEGPAPLSLARFELVSSARFATPTDPSAI